MHAACGQHDEQLLQVVTDEVTVLAPEPGRQRTAVGPGHVPARSVAGGQRHAEDGTLERASRAGAPADPDRPLVRSHPALELGPVGVGAHDPRVDMLDRAAGVGQRIRLPARACFRRGIGRRGCAAEQVQAELQSALRLALERLRAGRRHARRRQAVDERPELELPEALGDGAAVVPARARLLQPELDRQVAHDAADFSAHERRLAVLGEALPELALDLVEVLVDPVQRAELLEQAAGRLLADPRHAGDVVARVALEGLVVEHLVWAEAVSVHHLRLVVDDRRGDAHPRREQADVVVHELEPVEVARHDHRVHPLRGRLLRQGADDVIGLVALQLPDRHAHHRRDLAHDRELGPQVVRHARPALLVLGVRVETELRLAHVEADHRVVRLHVLHAAQDDLQEPEHGVHERAVRHRQRREREVPAVDEARPVDEHEERSAVGHRYVRV